MRSVLALSQNDFRSTFRDPLIKALLFLPFISFGLVRWLWPVIVERYPPAEPYSLVVLMWACLQSATMFGFVYGFLILEEKEENVWEAIRILPVSSMQLTFSRLLIGLGVSAIVNYCMIHWGNIAHLSFREEFLLSVQFSLAAPLITLVLGAFASNRIEGLAQMKILNLLLILPGLIYFLPYKLVHVTALAPTYWSFRSMEYAAAGRPADFIIYFVVGLGFYLAIIYLLNGKLARGMNGK